MQVLFIHQNFPGQYPHLAAALLARGDQPVAIGGPSAKQLPGIPLHRYNPMPAGGVPACHPWAEDFQIKCLRAEAVARLLERLIGQGLAPDLVVGHPGWGELLAIKDLLPAVPVLHHEWPTMKPDSPFGYAWPRRPWKARSVMSYIRMSRPGTALDWARAGTASAARASVLRSMSPRE